MRLREAYAATAQWLDYAFPNIPRTATGEVDLNAPTPITFEDHPDLSGIWFAKVVAKNTCEEEGCIIEERMSRLQVSMGIDMAGGLPYTDWAKEQVAQRSVDASKADPHAYCMPPNFPRAWTLPQYLKIVQTSDLVVILHEFNAAYRQIYLDGRPMLEDPNPTWNGYSVGHWENETLVITTNGIRDDMWLDILGSPITSAATVTEKLSRPDFGTLHIEITVDDPKAYTRPWTVAFDHIIQTDTMLLDEICLDNEQDTALYELE